MVAMVLNLFFPYDKENSSINFIWNASYAEISSGFKNVR
jgi:hypothetical protein